MSHMRTVSDHIRRLGKASAKDVIPLCPELERKQVMQALNNAAYFGYLRKVGEIKPAQWGTGRAWAIYEHTGKVWIDARKEPRIERIASSVWDLARLAA